MHQKDDLFHRLWFLFSAGSVQRDERLQEEEDLLEEEEDGTVARHDAAVCVPPSTRQKLLEDGRVSHPAVFGWCGGLETFTSTRS